MEAEGGTLEALDALSPTTKRLLEQSVGTRDWSGELSLPEGKPAARKRNLEAEKKARANARRSSCRDREKRELMYLRALCEGLGKELVRLQIRGEERREARRMFGAQNPPGAWRAIALLGRKERKKAEQENARLRALWRSQLQFVANMQQFGEIQRGVCPPGGLEARLTFTDADVEAIGVLTEDLDALFEQSNRILANSGVSSLPERSFCRSQACCDTEGPTHGSIEMHSVMVLQSKYEDMREGATNIILGQFFASGAIRFRIERNARHTTVSIKLRHQACHSTKDGDDPQVVDMLLATRQYNISPDRHISVWKGIASESTTFCGAIASEFGVCVMHPSISDPSRSINRRMRRIEPMPPTTSREQSKFLSDGKQMSEVALQATEAVVSDALRAIGYEGP